MKTTDIIAGLERMKVQTGSLVCLGCGREHNCGTRGCAIIREAAERLRELQQDRDQMLKQLRYLSDCSTCKNDEACGGDNWEWNGGTPRAKR